MAEEGIKVDNRWLNSFECFYNWAVNNGHNTELSIDRINVNRELQTVKLQVGDLQRTVKQ